MAYEYIFNVEECSKAGWFEDFFEDLDPAFKKKYLYFLSDKPIPGIAHPKVDKAQVIAEIESQYGDY